jgi:hypothetical protein
MTETFPRGNCENKKMGTKIIKQDICKPIFTMEYKSNVPQALDEQKTGVGDRITGPGNLFMLSPLLAMLILATKRK